ETRPAKGHGETVDSALTRWDARIRGFGTVGLAAQWEGALEQRVSVDGARLSLSDIVLRVHRNLASQSDGARTDRTARLQGEVVRTLHDAGVDRSEALRLGTFGVRRAVEDGTLAVSRPEDLAAKAVERVAEKKATWTRNDLARQVARLTRRDPAFTPEGLQERVDRLVELGLRPGGGVVALTGPPLVEAPAGLRRASDGRSEHDRHIGVRYAADQALLAEGRLVEMARTGGAPVVTAGRIVEQVDRFGLGADQEAAARHVLGSGRCVDAVVGPAGTGKTHTTAAIAAAWEADGRPVLGLALSQNAAQVLAEASGARAENIAKWLHENGSGRPGWQVQRGQLVIVDEAAMVPTAQLDQVVGRVVAAGGKVLLVGDPEQLAAPGAGGAMRLLVADVGAAHLEEVRRFDSPWEAQASLRLRAGDPDALVEYNRRARISGGTAEQAQEAAYRAWLADTLSGRTSLLLADINEQAAELAGRARVDLVRAGRVEADGVVLADGNQAGVGDRIVTRRNDRRLGEPEGMVANRDEWTVEAVSADRSLRVRRHDDPDRPDPQTLPGSYVAEHVQLAYASTVHAAQSRTVDTAHAVMSARTGRDSLYVALTRGREGNWAYVACDTR
ncbi:MAG TPA: AAA family ATPase, partial [Acidimicrobiales bacterium]|nr:AAA family ATPase [Acidimicrobiales bacterium]